MITNIEFLDIEPLENVITSLHYRVDRTVFFGFSKTMAVRKDDMERFLQKYCGVREVEFHQLSETNLEENLYVLREVVTQERAQGNQVFFDVTGGESLLLLAFGMIAQEMNCPMHMYDVEQDWLYTLNRKTVPTTINDVAVRHEVKLDIDRYVELFGGAVNYAMQKDIKSLDDPEYVADVKGLWQICRQSNRGWNLFCEFLRRFAEPDEALFATLHLPTVGKTVKQRGRFRKGPLTKIFNQCVKLGIFTDIYESGDTFSFRYKSQHVLDLLWDAGSVLELHTYMEERQHADDCRVGVHVDWDGIINGSDGADTVNEIDVMSLHGFLPTFISCKNGNADQMDLYELDTVAKRFGGKYARKIIVVPMGLNPAHLERAREMGIEVRR